ncbi:hypothetical protein MMC25_001421 [Agyrium rufum]|nr:hypothetical protein [Agyrium rufum]
MSSDAAPPSAAETDSQAAAVANTTGVTPDTLKASLTEKLGAEYVEVDDISEAEFNFGGSGATLGGCGQSFQAVIVSPQFDGKRSLARHRLVNSALQAEIAAIHAWTPKCYTPEEWEKQRGG